VLSVELVNFGDQIAKPNLAFLIRGGRSFEEPHGRVHLVV
jgi:hypothetical protein